MTEVSSTTATSETILRELKALNADWLRLYADLERRITALEEARL